MQSNLASIARNGRLSALSGLRASRAERPSNRPSTPLPQIDLKVVASLFETERLKSTALHK